MQEGADRLQRRKEEEEAKKGRKVEPRSVPILGSPKGYPDPRLINDCIY